MVNPEATLPGDAPVSCDACEAVCCRLEVLLIGDTGVPEEFIHTDEWGGMTMATSDDGWCAALNPESMRCRIYDRRPWVCREFQLGGAECVAERAAYASARQQGDALPGSPDARVRRAC